MKKIVSHLRDNQGEVNVSRMVCIAIVCVVGAILLVTLTSAFEGPIRGWLYNVMDDWFGVEQPSSGWIYNGNIIPPYPNDYNSWGYNYYLIIELEGMIGYYGFESPEIFADLNHGTIGIYNDVDTTLYVLENGNWQFVSHGTESGGTSADNASLSELKIIASNFDIYDSNGNVYQAAQDLEKYYEPIS